MSGFGGTNPFVQLKDMLSEGSPAIATVSGFNSDGTATVTMRGGEQKRVRGALGELVAGDNVVVDSRGIVGLAPDTTPSIVSIG